MYIFILNRLLFVLHAGRSSIINHVDYHLAYRFNINSLQDIYWQETFIYIVILIIYFFNTVMYIFRIQKYD